MSTRESTISQRIQIFVDNAITNLVKGLVLLLIGLSDAFDSLGDDVSHGKVRIGRGLIIIGLFSMLGAVPQLIESLEAGVRFLKLREEKEQTKNQAGTSESEEGSIPIDHRTD